VIRDSSKLAIFYSYKICKQTVDEHIRRIALIV